MTEEVPQASSEPVRFNLANLPTELLSAIINGDPSLIYVAVNARAFHVNRRHHNNARGLITAEDTTWTASVLAPEE